MTGNPAQYDVFVSYRHGRKDEVQQLCHQLHATGLSYFRDEERRDDDASIQRTIEQGLAQSRLLLAWFDPTYLHSRACAWEFSRALIAAQGRDGGLERIIAVDPTHRFTHVIPEPVRDQTQLLSADRPDRLPALIAERAKRFTEPFGRIVTARHPGWYERELPTHPNWVGRANALIGLFHELMAGRAPLHGANRAPVAITGWGGEGKTMLAQQYALRFASAYPGGVVWLSGSTIDGVTEREADRLLLLESALTAAATGRLRIPVDEIVKGEADPVKRIRAIRDAIDRAIKGRIEDTDAEASREAVAPYLWIIDDLPSEPDTAYQQLWLPADPAAHCLATIRESKAVAGVFRPVELDPMDTAEALALLTHRRPPVDERERALARAIAQRLGGLPLGLELAAHLAEDLGYAELLAVLNAPGTEELDTLAGALPLPTAHSASIVKTFLRSLERLPGHEADSGQDFATWTMLHWSTQSRYLIELSVNGDITTVRPEPSRRR